MVDWQKRKHPYLGTEDERCNLLAELALEGIAFSVDGVIVDANEQVARMHGYTRDEIIGMAVGDLLAPESRERALAVLRSGQSGLFEDIGVKKDGSAFPVEVNLRTLERDGQPVRVAVVRDSTERKRAEERLRDSEERFRTLANNIAPLVWMADGEGYVFWYNQRWYDYTGKTAPELEGLGWQQIHHPEYREQSVQRVKEGLAGREPWEDTFYLRGKDGNYRWFLARTVPMKDAQGKVTRWFGTATDVTAERENAESLRRRVEELETLMDLVPAAIWVSYDADCHVITGNRMANEFYEAGPDENVSAAPAPGQVANERLFYRDGQLLAPEELPMQYAAANNVEVRNEVLDVHLPSGRWINMIGSASPLRDAEGNVRGCIGAFLNISDRHAAEEALRASEENLKLLVDNLARSNRDLQQLAYVASHDLQEPLRQVIAFAQLIEDRYAHALEHEAREYMDFVVEGARRMHTLIVDLLTYSRVDSQEQNLGLIQADTSLDQALYNLQLAIKESDATITREPLPVVWADNAQLVQLFQNLIANAIKFRDKPRPLVHIGAKKQEGEYVFSVSDNGIGFDPDYADKIFQIFQRLHSRGTYGGTGIGLTICKRIVERHGGRIWAESQPGVGSTFFFTLPVS